MLVSGFCSMIDTLASVSGQPPSGVIPITCMPGWEVYAHQSICFIMTSIWHALYLLLYTKLQVIGVLTQSMTILSSWHVPQQTAETAIEPAHEHQRVLGSYLCGNDL